MWWAWAVTALLLALFTSVAGVSAQQLLYRYVDEDGRLVIHHTIPVEYVQRGYEILNANGQLIEVVPPAPSADELERADAERQVRERYVILKRRYSTVDDIEDEASHLEDSLLTEATSELRQEMAQLRKQTIAIKRYPAFQPQASP